MTPEWNPELLEDAWKKLRERTAPPSHSGGHSVPTDLRARRGLSRRARLALSGAALFGSLILMSIKVLVRGELEVLGWGALLSVGLGIVLLDQTLPGRISGALSDGGRPIALTRGPRRGLLGILALGTLLVFASLAESFAHWDGGVKIPFLHCTTHSLITGAVALSALLWIWRRTDPFSPSLTGGLLGASSGIVGALAVTLVCTNREGFHLLLSHGLTTTALAICGAWIGRRTLTPS